LNTPNAFETLKNQTTEVYLVIL